MNKHLFACILVSVLGFMGSCTYKNVQDTLAGSICDTSAVTYSGTISNIMNQHCNSCHGGVSPAAGISTEGYNNVKSLVLSGQLWGTMNHNVGYSPMPKGMPKLDECSLAKLKAWINAGYPNN